MNIQIANEFISYEFLNPRKRCCDGTFGRIEFIFGSIGRRGVGCKSFPAVVKSG
jgi:hypothetical protein